MNKISNEQTATIQDELLLELDDRDLQHVVGGNKGAFADIALDATKAAKQVSTEVARTSSFTTALGKASLMEMVSMLDNVAKKASEASKIGGSDIKLAALRDSLDFIKNRPLR